MLTELLHFQIEDNVDDKMLNLLTFVVAIHKYNILGMVGFLIAINMVPDGYRIGICCSMFSNTCKSNAS